MSRLYQIPNWNTRFENERSRRLTTLTWIKIDNNISSVQHRRLLALPDGTALYGVWCLLAQLVSQQDSNSGKRDGWVTIDGTRNGSPWSVSDLAITWGRPEREIGRALAVFSDLGWLVDYGEVATIDLGLVGNLPNCAPRAVIGVDSEDATSPIYPPGLPRPSPTKEGRKERKNEIDPIKDGGEEDSLGERGIEETGKRHVSREIEGLLEKRGNVPCADPGDLFSDVPPPLPPKPLAETRPDIQALKAVAPGLKLVPDDRAGFLALAEDVGLEVLAEAARSILRRGDQCWLADVTEEAYAIQAKQSAPPEIVSEYETAMQSAVAGAMAIIDRHGWEAVAKFLDMPAKSEEHLRETLSVFNRKASVELVSRFDETALT